MADIEKQLAHSDDSSHHSQDLSNGHPPVDKELQKETRTPEPIDDEEYVDQENTAEGGDEGGLAAPDPPVDLEKTVTSKSKHSVNSLSTVPNGGLLAWLQVAGSFFLFFNSWGIINTFGVYQTYYETGLLQSSSPSDISWIGSVQAAMLLIVGAATGPVYDAGYFKTLVAVGSFCVVFGHMMLSLCNAYWQVLLAQAFVVGIGAGCLFLPSVALISQYFSTKIAPAVGIAATGSSLGGVLYPIILYKLLPQVGFAWATRIIGFVALATLALPNIVMKPRVFPAERRKIVDWSAFTEAPYVLFILGSVFAFGGLYIAFFYVESYAMQYHITNPDLAFYLLSILNSASVFGRVVPNIIAQFTGPFNMIIPCAMLSGILTLCLIPVRDVAPLIIICLLYGFMSGSMVSLPPTIFVHLTKNRGMIGTRMGQGFTIVSIGLLIGTPGAGWILNASHGDFKYVWVFGGTTTILGSVIMLASRMIKADWKIITKV